MEPFQNARDTGNKAWGKLPKATEKKRGRGVLWVTITGNLPSAVREHWAESLCHHQCQIGQEVKQWAPWSQSRQEA